MKKLMTLAISLAMLMALTVPCFATSPYENVALRLAVTTETEPTQQHHYDDKQPPAESTVTRPTKPDTNDEEQNPTPLVPIPTPEPKARFMAESIVLDAEGDEVTKVVIGETYSLVTAIRASLTGTEVISLDARNLRIRMNHYSIMHGFKSELLIGMAAAPLFIVYDNESDVASGYNRTTNVSLVDEKRAIVSYVKNSAELVTRDGEIIALSDAEFLTQEGALIGSYAADGILLAEDVATVRLKFTVEEYKDLPIVNDLNGNPLPETTQNQTPANNQTPIVSMDSETAQKPPIDQKSEASPALYEDDLHSKEYFAEKRLRLIEAKANDTQKTVNWLLVVIAMLLLACVILAACLAGLNNKVDALSKHIDEAKNNTFSPPEQDGKNQEHPRRYGDFFKKQGSDEAGAEGEYDAEHIREIPDEEID